MSVLTANINFLASLGITTSEQFTAAFGDMAAFTEYCTAIGYSWELGENNDIILITPDGKKVNTYVQSEESEKTATPEIVVTPGDTEYTFEATGDGTVKLYIDGTEVSNPVAIPRTNEAQEVTATATAQEEGKQISDEAWEEVTIPALSGPSSIDFDQGTYTAEGIPEGQQATVSPFSVTDNLGNLIENDCTYSFSPNTTSLYVDGNQFCVDGSDPAGNYSVEVTAEYNGLTATATVDFEIVAPVQIPNYMKLTVLNESGNDGEISIIIPQDVNTSYATSISYSKDGTNWTDTAVTDLRQVISIPVSAGDEVYLKGIANRWGNVMGDYSTRIVADVRHNVSGNIMSLLYGDNFANQTTLTTGYAFSWLFGDYYDIGSNLVDASQLELPATELSNYCYLNMFKGCTLLTTAPVLPAISLKRSCYCYMFSGCSSLNRITMLATNISATKCLYGWVQGVAATGTFTKSPNMTSLPTGNDGIPTGWTVIDIQPEPQSLSQQISSILGQDVEIINDMSEQDALAAANEILYGSQE